MESRVKKSLSNMTFGVVEQIATLVFTFITRTVFVKTLDANLLGVNGLFTNVLAVLSIAELGFETAIIYSMYKPIAEKDEKKIAAFMNYYKKIYNILAVVVFILGIMLIPFLKYLVNTDDEIDNILIYYLIFLADSICSYLLANRVAIITANQNIHIISKYNTFFIILKSILQIISLVIFKNFIIYLIIQVLVTLITNLYGARLAHKMYPFAFSNEKLDKEEKKKLIDSTKSMAIYKFCGTIVDSTDNIFMSVICGTINVGLYSNYCLIISAITRFTNIIYKSITASIGNLNAVGNKEKKIKTFYQMDFFSNWLFGFCSIALYCLSNPFIELWIGKKYLFNNVILFSIVLNFYILGILKIILVYRDTTGLFRQTKYVLLLTATINIILSIVLGKIYGVFGILIASAIARLLTNCWYEPYKLFKNYFKTSSIKYFIDKILNIILIVISILILSFLYKFIEYINMSKLLCFIVKIILVVVIPNIIFYAVYRNKEEFEYFKKFINDLKIKVKEKIVKNERKVSN